MPVTLTSAVSRAENSVDVALSGPVRAVDAVDPFDGQNPALWSLAGPGAVRVVAALPTKLEGLPDRASAFRLVVVPAFVPGGAYSVAPVGDLRDAAGVPVGTAAAAFAGLGRAPFAGPTPGRPGADVPLPVRRSPDGGPALAGELEAYRRRLELLAEARLGGFKHLPGFGRGLEPKRNYTAAQLARAAAELVASVRADPDTLRGSVSLRQTAPGLVEVVFEVEPRFGARPLTFGALVVAGEAP